MGGPQPRDLQTGEDTSRFADLPSPLVVDKQIEFPDDFPILRSIFVHFYKGQMKTAKVGQKRQKTDQKVGVSCLSRPFKKLGRWWAHGTFLRVPSYPIPLAQLQG